MKYFPDAQLPADEGHESQSITFRYAHMFLCIETPELCRCRERNKGKETRERNGVQSGASAAKGARFLCAAQPVRDGRLPQVPHGTVRGVQPVSGEPQLSVVGAGHHLYRLGRPSAGAQAGCDPVHRQDGEHGPTTVGLSGHKSIPLYGKAEAFRFVSDVVYTNHMSAGAYRGYGATQGLFAVESAVNEALRQAEDAMEKSMSSVTGGLNLGAFYIRRRAHDACARTCAHARALYANLQRPQALWQVFKAEGGSGIWW